MKPDTAKGWPELLPPWITVGALIVGGIFAVQQYVEKKSDDRIKEAINFLDRYNREPFSIAHDRIEIAWEANAKDEEKCKAAAGCVADFNSFLMGVIEKESLRSSVFVIVDFYSSLAACVDEGICDKSISKRFFRDEAASYFYRHYPLIMQEREQQKNTKFGAGLESIANL